VNRALQLTLLGLVAVIVAFAVTWVSIPSGTSSDVPLPASLFIFGIGDATYECLYRIAGATACAQRGDDVIARKLAPSDVSDLKERTVVIFGSAAAVIVLLGLAFGAARRDRPEAAPS
jgi:hypothetical protein